MGRNAEEAANAVREEWDFCRNPFLDFDPIKKGPQVWLPVPPIVEETEKMGERARAGGTYKQGGAIWPKPLNFFQVLKEIPLSN